MPLTPSGSSIPPRRIALMVNPTSGRGRAARSASVVQDALVATGAHADIIMGTDAEDALARARGAVASGYDSLVACGGDGTVHLALQAVAGTECALGIVPLGSGNDIARVLGIPSALPEAAALIGSDARRHVDMAEVTAAGGEHHWFLGVLSAGFDSMVNERANGVSFPPGQAKYLSAIVAELGTFQPVMYELDLDGVTSSGEGMLVAVGNGTSYGGGMKVCPGAVMDDGLLSVVFLGRVSKPTFLRVLPRVFSGRHIEHPAVTEHTASSVRIAGEGQIAYADGERVGHLPITVHVHPLALTVLAPPTPLP